mgnify:CR=1 FL=1
MNILKSTQQIKEEKSNNNKDSKSEQKKNLPSNQLLENFKGKLKIDKIICFKIGGKVDNEDVEYDDQFSASDPAYSGSKIERLVELFGDIFDETNGISDFDEERLRDALKKLVGQ